MDERILFDRIHQALDVEPQVGAYERLRIALTNTAAKPQRSGLRLSRPEMGLRFAAIMTLVVVVIAIAAASVFLATQRFADRTAPADSDQAINAYKLMVSDNFSKVSIAAGALKCNSSTEFAACEADAINMLHVANQYLDALIRFPTPRRFAIVDAQLRRHIEAQNSRTYALIAASRAHDAAAADRELAAMNGETGGRWGTQMASSILRSRQETAATYLASVRSEKQGLDGCIECQDLAGQKQISCAGDQASTCQDLVDTTARQVKGFQAALVTIAAPNSLVAKDSTLQLDLGQAETALKAMVDALAAVDQAGFNAGRIAYQQAIPSINRDAADILNS
jgi:hypothetical protein